MWSHIWKSTTIRNLKVRSWGGIETINRTLEGWAAEKGLNYTLIDPTELSELADFPLGERVTPDGSSRWSDNDPVHLSLGELPSTGLYSDQCADPGWRCRLNGGQWLLKCNQIRQREKSYIVCWEVGKSWLSGSHCSSQGQSGDESLSTWLVERLPGQCARDKRRSWELGMATPLARGREKSNKRPSRLLRSSLLLVNEKHYGWKVLGFF